MHTHTQMHKHTHTLLLQQLPLMASPTQAFKGLIVAFTPEWGLAQGWGGGGAAAKQD